MPVDTFKTVTLPIIVAMVALLGVISGLGSWAVVSINGRIGDVNTTMNSRFANIDTRFAIIDAKLDALSSRSFNIERSVGSLLEPGVVGAGQVSISSLGGRFVVAQSPVQIELDVPPNAVTVRASLIREPHCASTANLGSPPGVKPVQFSYGFTAFTNFSHPVGVIFRLTSGDIQRVGATRLDEVAAFRWVPSDGKWITLPVSVDSGLQTLRTEIPAPTCLMLAVRSP